MFTEWFSNLPIPSALSSMLSLEIIFIALSSIIAIVIFFEGQVLKKTHGKIPQNIVFHVASALDTSWFVVAVAALYFLDFQSIDKSVPVIYMIYTVFGWIYGTMLMSENGLPDSPKDLVIPPKYVAYSQSFSLVFFALCIAVIYMQFSGTCLPFSLPFM